jgi:tripartite-type tricarboxylate transporter receptor subunit TctC
MRSPETRCEGADGHRRSVLSLLGLSIVAPLSWAQGTAYPNRLIRLVVAYSAGGGTDSAARIVAEALARELKTPVIVENKAGASGNIGGAYVAKAPADGYTLLFGAMANLAINPHLYAEMGYQPGRDFAPVCEVFDTAHVIVASPTAPFKTLPEFIAAAKRSPKKYTFASAGAGSSTHIVAELFAYGTGTELVHIPYKGNAPAIVDVMAGVVDTMFDQVPNSAPQIAAGKVRPLAVMAAQRLPSLPDVPSVSELGYPNLVASSWTGLFAPAGTPTGVIATLNAAMAKVLATPEVVAKLNTLGAVPGFGSPEAMGRLLKSDSERFGKLVAAAKIKVE